MINKDTLFINLLKSNIQEDIEEGIGKKIATGALAVAIAASPLIKKIYNKNSNIEVNSKKNVSSQYSDIVDNIIDNIEGGYYNKGQVNNKLYSTSGETMFGIDRKNGGDINKSTEGKKFWRIIDNSRKNNKKLWVWKYKGGDDEETLKSLVKKMIYPKFEYFMDRYLSEDAKEIVKSDYNLYYNFVYATWNGQGWFRKFASKINSEVDNGNIDPKSLFKVAIDARVNSGNTLIEKSAEDILKQTK